jgi:hypothetical protein
MIAVKQRLEFADAIDVDKRGTVDAPWKYSKPLPA